MTGAVVLLGLIRHLTVRKVRREDGNPLAGLLYAIAQTVMLVMVFYLLFAVLGLRGNALRGDFLLYLLSGIFLFLTFNKTMTSVVAAEGSTSNIMLHAPMNTVISIASSALSALYLQVLSLLVVLGAYHLIWGPVHIDRPIAAFAMLLLAWFSAVGVGLLFLAAKPWAPKLVQLLVQLFTRANMIASGKMFLANSLPGSIRKYFEWNPLYHAIDQARGFTFVNYNPHYTSIGYPLKLAIVLIFIGLLAEHYTRQRASLSWSAGR